MRRLILPLKCPVHLPTLAEGSEKGGRVRDKKTPARLKCRGGYMLPHNVSVETHQQFAEGIIADRCVRIIDAGRG